MDATFCAESLWLPGAVFSNESRMSLFCSPEGSETNVCTFQDTLLPSTIASRSNTSVAQKSQCFTFLPQDVCRGGELRYDSLIVTIRKTRNEFLSQSVPQILGIQV